MKEMLEKIKEQAEKQIAAATSPEALDEIKVSVLGKKGELTQILKGMKDVAPEDRPKVGQMVNSVRDVLEEFAVVHKRLGLREIQRCPFGEAYVRLTNVRDRDKQSPRRDKRIT